MSKVNIVAIGAGSDVFGLNTIATLLHSQRLQGSQLTLVDINAETLISMTRLADRANREWKSGFKIKSTTQVEEALPDADYVILSIAPSPREGLWKSDWEIPLRFGVRQPYAENSGPGGLAQTLRNLPPVMEIVHKMETYCPQAWLVNFTNPMQRICDAVNRYSNIKVAGLCHQIGAAYAMIGKVLAKELDIEVPPAFTSTHSTPSQNAARASVSHQTMQKIDIQAAGVNHFTWMLGVYDRRSGEDLYPLFKQRWETFDPAFEPLTRRIYSLFGIFPIPGDEHLCEYLPWMSDPQTRPWEKFDLSLYDWDLRAKMREDGHNRIAWLADEAPSLEGIGEVESEGEVELIEGVSGALNTTWGALNLPNHGQISNLPAGAIVETPVVMTGRGPRPMMMGALPGPVAELCRREIATSQLAVDAGVLASRQAALQCLLIDPVVTDIDTAEKILDAYLNEYAPYLPNW
jgi:alpha-galactosidase